MMAKLCLSFAIMAYISGVQARNLCSRIFFENMDKDHMPYKFIEGVYIKQANMYNDFPVYKRENDNLLFYLYNSKSLVYGLKLGSYFGAGARMSTSPLTWLGTGKLDENDVFGGLISYFIYYNHRDNSNYRVYSPPYIKAVCVDDNFRECNSGKVYLNSTFNDGNGNVLSDKDTDYFERVKGNFRNLRPVYKHNKQNWYLQYTADNYWLVTTTRYPTSGNNDRGALMRVVDYALRPEYINNVWSILYKTWYTKPDLKIKCRGVRSQTNICSSNPCQNQGTCIFTSGNESVCACKPGFYGSRCANNIVCPSPTPLTSEIGFAYPGGLPGYVAMTFCRSSYPSFRYAICADGYSSPYWSRQGSSCRNVITTNKPWSPWKPVTTGKNWQQPTASPIDFDDMPELSTAILACAIILQILLPFIFWCCALCTTTCKESGEEEQDEQRRLRFEENLEERLENVRRAETQEELEQRVQDYRQTIQDYEQVSEATELKRKKGVYRNASLFRLYSMILYISSFLWLFYFIVCKATNCTQYGKICGQLNIMAIVMMIICPLFVFVESIFSHELAYIRNIMMDETAWGYIQKLWDLPPVVSMVVECYHFETRTRVVYYTDANGNSQSRTETYTERVVTFVDYDTFKYGCWIDTSKKEMPTVSSIALTRLKIDPHVLWGDQETLDDFERQKQEMLARNEHRDEHTDFTMSQSIPGMEKRICAYINMSVKPWWISHGYFWLATFLHMTWPYRWVFRAKTAKSYYDLKKKMYKSTSPPPEIDISDPIAILRQAQVPVLADGASNNPSFALTELPSNALQGVSPFHPDKGCTPGNQGAQYPPTNQATNQVPLYPPANNITPYTPANHEDISHVNQDIPNIPPPSYQSVVDQTATSPSYPVV